MFTMQPYAALLIVGLPMRYSHVLDAFIPPLCLPDCEHEYASSGEMEELPIRWMLRKLDLLRVSFGCLECSASVSFNQWKLLGEKAASLSCPSSWPGLVLFSTWLSLPVLFRPFCDLFITHSCCPVEEAKIWVLSLQKFSKSSEHYEWEEKAMPSMQLGFRWWTLMRCELDICSFSSSGKCSALAQKISMKQRHSSATALLNGACHIQAWPWKRNWLIDGRMD